MSPLDPTHGLANPYARTDGAGCSARVAGRALAVGALGLGAVAVFTGTGFADEAPTAEDAASEVTSDEVTPEAEEGQDAPVADAEVQPAAEGEVLQFASGTDAPVDAEDLMFYSGLAQTPDGGTGGQETDPGQDAVEPLTGTATGMVPRAPDDQRRPGPTDQQVEQDRIARWQDRVAQWEASGEPLGGGYLPPGPPSDPNWEFTDPGRHYDPILGGWVPGPGPATTSEDETLGGTASATVPPVPGVGGRPESTGSSEPSGPRLIGERLAQRQEHLAERQERLAQRQERLAQRQERLAERQERRAAGRGGVLVADPGAVPDVSPALAEAGSGGGDLFPGSSAGSLGGGYLFPGLTPWSHPGGSGS